MADFDTLRAEHTGPGYERDDVSTGGRCCYACDEPVPCRTLRLLDAHDDLAAVLDKVRALADDWVRREDAAPYSRWAVDGYAAADELAALLLRSTGEQPERPRRRRGCPCYCPTCRRNKYLRKKAGQ